MQIIADIFWGTFGLIVILAIYCAGRALRTGLEESDWYDDEF